jgi:anti-anti-sigma factor
MFGFEKKCCGDVVILVVNVARATLGEARLFKKLIDDELNKRTLKMVIDLSNCEFVDSTFIGVLVVTLKKISSIGGELRLVEPSFKANSTLATTRILEIFNIYKTQEEAIGVFTEA